MKLVATLFAASLLLAAPAYASSVIRASWYGPGFQGRPMANGAVFDQSNPTIAASRTLPFGTRLVLANLANGRELSVVVQDRGPYGTLCSLDLSHAAAEHLGFINQGTARLKILQIIRKKKKHNSGHLRVSVRFMQLNRARSR